VPDDLFNYQLQRVESDFTSFQECTWGLESVNRCLEQSMRRCEEQMLDRNAHSIKGEHRQSTNKSAKTIQSRLP